MSTVAAMKERRIEINQIIKVRQAVLVSEMGLTDNSTDREWDAMSDKLEAEMPELFAERTSLTIAIETTEARDINEAIAAEKSNPVKHCPKCGAPMTASGKCDECDDWDN